MSDPIKKVKKFKIFYKYRENSNAVFKQWQHDYNFLTATNEAAAVEGFKSGWTANSEMIIKSIMPLNN